MKKVVNNKFLPSLRVILNAEALNFVDNLDQDILTLSIANGVPIQVSAKKANGVLVIVFEDILNFFCKFSKRN